MGSVAKRCAVYTCVTNGYDRVVPPVDPVPGVDHILFTDRPESDVVDGWITRKIAVSDDLSPTLTSRYHKSLPHRILPEYDSSIFIDGNIAIISSLTPFLELVFGGPEKIAIHRHPSRSSVREEADACLQVNRVKNPDALRREVKQYEDDGFPDTLGMVGSAIVARWHNDPQVIEAMEMWWDLLSKGSGRDQISFPYMMWKLNPPIRIIEPHFSIESPYFRRYPHWAESGSRAQAYIWALQRRRRGPVNRAILGLIERSYGDRLSF